MRRREAGNLPSKGQFCTMETTTEPRAPVATDEERSLWGWVHDHHEQAFVAGTALLAGLYALAGKPGSRLGRWAGAFGSALLVGATLDPLVNPRNPGLTRVYSHGPRHRRALALTFDDGPEPPYTERILDVLGEFGVKATFFVVGAQVLRHPQLARRILDEGHLLGNHTHSHPNLLLRAPAAAREELALASASIERVTGIWPQWFRPPFGFRYPWNVHQAARLGQATVTWSLNPRDFEFPPPDRLVQRVLREARNGDIVLLHDGMRDQSNTVAALPGLLRELSKRDYELLRVDQLLA